MMVATSSTTSDEPDRLKGHKMMSMYVTAVSFFVSTSPAVPSSVLWYPAARQSSRTSFRSCRYPDCGWGRSQASPTRSTGPDAGIVTKLMKTGMSWLFMRGGCDAGVNLLLFFGILSASPIVVHTGIIFCLVIFLAFYCGTDFSKVVRCSLQS